jgi:hypothetical protein
MQMGGQLQCDFAKVFQLVFQPKIKNRINLINQYDTYRIQITPAHQIRNLKPALKSGLLAFLGGYGK